MLPDERSQQILASKDADEALASCNEHAYSEGWAIIDGAVVIYNLDAPPHWLPSDDQRDENGNTREGMIAYLAAATKTPVHYYVLDAE